MSNLRCQFTAADAACPWHSEHLRAQPAGNLVHNRDMTPSGPTPVAHVEIVDGGVVLTFDDGEGAFLSAGLMHEAVSKAALLPEFSSGEEEALNSEVAPGPSV
jgi:hypothetical protein